MNRTIANLCGLSLIALCGVMGWAAWRVGISMPGPTLVAKISPILDATQTAMDNANPAIAEMNVAFSNLADATGDWSDASKQQARDVRSLLAAGGRAVDGITEDTNALRQTAGAATESAHALTQTIEEGQRTLRAVQPLIADSDGAVDDLRVLLRNQAIPATLTNLQNLTAESNAIMGDARRISDDATAKYFKPLPWYRKALPYATTGAKIAAYALPW